MRFLINDDASTSAMIVAFISDRQYAHSTGIAIKSLLRVSKPESVVIVNDGMETWQLNWLSSLSSRIEIIDLPLWSRDWISIFRMHGSKHVTRTTYAKALLAELLPLANRVLYLDGDVIVCQDPGPLFTEPMNNSMIGATYNFTMMSEGRRRLKTRGKYFNAGVLLCPLDKWRAGDVISRFRAWYETNHSQVKFDDQDIFNAIFDGKVRWIDKRWNVSQWEIFSKFQFISVPLAECGIIHFNGIEKPWNRGYARRWGLNKLYFDAAMGLMRPLAVHEGRHPVPLKTEAQIP